MAANTIPIYGLFGNDEFTSRLLAKTTAGAPDDCWAWAGRTNKKGYGWITIRGKPYRAHRLSYAVFRGDIPPSFCVLHKCDNPNCVNPNHLRLGSQIDNIMDMDAKGRRVPPPSGENSVVSKLTTSDVIDIRRRRASGERLYLIARDYPVTMQACADVIRRKTWKHVP